MKLTRAPAVLLVALQMVGCATTPPPSSSSVPPGISEPERQECEGFAQKEAERAAASIPSKAGKTAAAAGTALMVPHPLVGIVGLLLAVPLAVVGAIVGASQTERERTQRRTTAYAGAMETCLKPLILTLRLGPRHPDVAQALVALAAAYAEQGRPDTADALVQRAEEMVEAALSGPAPGPGPEAVWATLEDLARFHAGRGNTARADAALRRSLEARERVLGADHLDLADALDRSAGLLRSMNRDETAPTLEARALAIRTTAAGLVVPDRWDFGDLVLGTKSRPVPFVFTNRTGRVLHVRASGPLDYLSRRPADFSVVRDGCQDPVEVDGTCTLDVLFAPTGSAGPHHAILELHVQEVGTLSVHLSGRAQAAAP